MYSYKINQTVLLSLLLSLILFAPACLKTRSQIKNDQTPEQEKAGIHANVEPVKSGNKYEVEELKSEVLNLTGRVEDLERAKREAQDENAGGSDPKQLESRISELEQTQTLILTTLKSLQSNIPGATANDLYKKGEAEFKSGKLEDAANTLSLYLKKEPVSKNGNNTQKAIFLRAEAYLGLKEYKKAILDYSKFPEKFPTSSRLKDALYKIGLSFDALGMKNDAQPFYQELVERFPNSAEAKKARSKLPNTTTKKKSKRR